MRVFVDQDGPLAVWNENASIEETYMPGYFLNRAPALNTIEAVNQLVKEGTEVYLLSCVYDNGYAIQEKNQWIDNNGLKIDKAHRLFVPYGENKSEWLKIYFGIEDTDILIDDFSKNLHEWHGIGVKFRNHCNGTHGTWYGYSVDYRQSPEEIYRTIKGLVATA